MKPFAARVDEAVRFVRQQTELVPAVGIILGSGLGAVAQVVAVSRVIPTTSIPNFPPSTVDGHAGELLFGRLAGRSVLVVSGRVHGYEGHEPEMLGFAVWVVHALGARTLIVTNAAGALNPAYRPGDVMLIADHLSFPSLAGRSPLVGFPRDAKLRRFVDLTDAYSPELRALATTVAEELGFSLQSGTYVMVGGPNFETPAEVRFLRLAGGDAVGMSTAPEVIVARQLGLDVLGLSVLSNLAAGRPGALLGHEDVLAVVEQAAPTVARIIEGVVARLGA